MSVLARTVCFMIITCDSCAVRDIGCNDCVLTFLLSTPKSEQRSETCEIPDKTAEVIDLLSSRGLVRPLRYNSAG
jgi:hypothetical protein